MQKKLPQILITMPDLSMPGGVAHYYKSIEMYKSENISYFSLGKRPGEKGVFNAIGRLFEDIKNFKKELEIQNPSLVVVSPSLNFKALLRDRIFISIAQKRGLKTITFFRGWSTELAKKLKSLRFLITPFLKSNALITLSNESKQALTDLGFTGNIYVETTTVSGDVVNVQSNKKIFPESFTILFLSRFEKAKGLYEAVATFELLKKRYPNIMMQMAGDGSETIALKEFVAQSKISGIEFLGYISGSEKQQAFNNASVYFFPSYHNEGMPNSLLEAMCYGLPVVTRPTGGVVDFFEDGLMGFITESKKPEVFADLIEQLIKSKEKMLEMSNYNREYALKRFPAPIVVKRLETIFENVIDNN